MWGGTGDRGSPSRARVVGHEAPEETADVGGHDDPAGRGDGPVDGPGGEGVSEVRVTRPWGREVTYIVTRSTLPLTRSVT